MGYDWRKIPDDETGFECYRLDVWVPAGIHRISFFRENEAGLLELTAQRDDIRTAHTADEGRVTEKMSHIIEREGSDLAGNV